MRCIEVYVPTKEARDYTVMKKVVVIDDDCFLLCHTFDFASRWELAFCLERKNDGKSA